MTAGPIEAVACVAATPAEAKVFVARLQAEGIPARVEGDSLVDEFAAARRLMNLMGTRVMVPTRCLATAREILQPVAVDADELARQALAEPRQDCLPRDDGGGQPAEPLSLPVVVAVTVLVVGAVATLWFVVAG